MIMLVSNLTGILSLCMNCNSLERDIRFEHPMFLALRKVMMFLLAEISLVMLTSILLNFFPMHPLGLEEMLRCRYCIIALITLGKLILENFMNFNKTSMIRHDNPAFDLLIFYL